ncbi:Bifunctional F420 biosynthesis protein FbiB [Cupriavidus yeoncheonensis]|uniref:Bifunctional F420 biosynthesis protein FbiB n=1 Tax=Cupriavidus yeoncheonensis TaxID=1462994 RepID=A0A916J0G1_9BURK|nr:coenzyme F420-0:L-glutamate ligase [Cupriavidus yeoncheonensis]CAG2157669.1 Bifunctional F420 biosynthesis protein FbiB [Cupriavidus yeoncheonensis]
MTGAKLQLTALPDIPMIEPGDDLAGVLIDGLRRADIVPRDRDVLVIAQKVVSKAEGRYVPLAGIVPSTRAQQLAAEVGKDARMVELILSESTEVVRYRPGVLVVEHRLGFVMANAGIDQSNITHPDGQERALLLPRNPDASCAQLKARLDDAFGVDLGVVINDSFGRPWRNGVVGVALGAAGLPSLVNLIGQPDLYGRDMRVTEIALADEIAAAASLLMGQTDAGRPAIHLRGLAWQAPACSASALLRPRQIDMFR